MFDYFDFIYFLCALLILAMGFMVVFNNRKTVHGVSFFIFALAAVGWFLTLYLGYYYVDRADWDLGLFWMRLAYGFSVLGMSCMTLFLYFFPSPIHRVPYFLRLLYIILTIFLFLLCSFTPFINESFLIINDVYIKDTLGSWYLVYVFDLLFNLLASFFLAIDKMRKIQGIEKQKMNFVAIGYFSFVTIAVMTNVVLPIFNIVVLQKEIPLLMLIFIGFSYYAIQRYRFFHFSFVSLNIAKEGFLLITYVLVTAFINKLLTSFFFTFPAWFSLAISALLAIAVYLYLRKIIHTKLGFSFGGLHNALAEFKTKIFECDTYEKIQKTTEEIFSIKLNFEAAKICVLRKRGFKTDSEKINIFYENQFSEVIKKFKKDVVIKQEVNYLNISKSTKKILHDGLKKMKADLCLPLFTQGRLFGILALRRKNEEKILAKDIIDGVLGIQESLEIALMNILLKMNIQEENDLMKKIIEERTKKLQSQLDEIKTLFEQQADFIRITAHELRTPLTVAILQTGEILRKSRDKKPKEMTSDLKVVEKSLDNLKGLTQVLFEVQKYDLNKVTLNAIKTDLVDFLRNIHKDFSFVAKEKKIKCLFQTRFKNPLYLEIDCDRMRQVINNLLNNASKFTEKGGSITVSLAKAKGALLIKVSDTGKGIPADQKSHIFEKFKTGNGNIGLGLGLYLAKKIVELHKGKIWAEDTPGGGATFCVELPLIAA